MVNYTDVIVIDADDNTTIGTRTNYNPDDFREIAEMLKKSVKETCEFAGLRFIKVGVSVSSFGFVWALVEHPRWGRVGIWAFTNNLVLWSSIEKRPDGTLERVFHVETDDTSAIFVSNVRVQLGITDDSENVQVGVVDYCVEYNGKKTGVNRGDFASAILEATNKLEDYCG